MKEALRLTAVAFLFLTRLPMPRIRVADGDLARASAAFPLVGIAVALVGVGARGLGEPLWGALVGTIAAVVVMVAATGALHEDGLADCADGLWGGPDPERRLLIMRDSRVGTFGVLALVTALGLRVALLAPLGLGPFAVALVGGAALGRGAATLLPRLLPAAAAGTGASVRGPLGVPGALIAAGTVALALVPAGRWAPLLLLAAVLALAAWWGVLRRRLGGFTGDGLGAVVVLVDLAVVAVVAALVHRGLW